MFRKTFEVSLLHFLPIVVVIVMAALRFPPFTTIMTEALALLKGAWLALASGFHVDAGLRGHDQLASRGG